MVDKYSLQHYCCRMIPDLIHISDCPFLVLPAGIHDATIHEIRIKFASNRHRCELFKGLLNSLKNLHNAGCRHIYLDGSFVTDKEMPSDYDGCWDSTNVDLTLLDPVFCDVADLRTGRLKQKSRYKGEFFLANTKASPTETYVDFFQNEKISGKKKGILRVNLETDGHFKKRGQK